MIEIKNLKFKYHQDQPSYILDDVSFHVKRGEWLSIVGHNGSGKSTTARLIDGLLVAESGQIIVDGQELTEENVWDIRDKIGMVFQNPDNQLVATIVEEDVAFGPQNFGVSKEEAEQRAIESLKLVGLPEEFHGQNPFDLSGGQMRRVAIAGILAMQPDILVLDEPTAGLDPQGRKELMSLFKELHLSGMTIVLVTHLMDDVADYATAVNVMEKGQLVFSGAPKDVFQKVTFLKEKQLGVPKITEFALQLQEKGYRFETLPITIEEFVEVVSHG